jgi:hypothetical protein
MANNQYVLDANVFLEYIYCRSLQDNAKQILKDAILEQIQIIVPSLVLDEITEVLCGNLDDIKEVERDFERKDLDKVRHNEIKTRSIIDVPLWDKAKWKGFGFLFHPQEGLGIIIAYENADAGIKIFDKWINKFGREDKLNLIRISIIKGVDESNPYWYRVHISTNLEIKNSLQPNSFFTVASRIHEMNANSPENLNNLIGLFKSLKEYTLYPAKISHSGNEIKPFFSKGILKTTLIIKEAWEIGENDLDRVVIKENDRPIIPEGNIDAPILKILNRVE